MIAVVSLTLLATLCIGAVARPHWALALLLLMFALEQSLQGSVPIFRVITPLANFIVAVFVGIAALRAFFRQERALLGLFTRPWFITMAIFVYAIISLLWTPSRVLATEMTMTGLPYLILCILVAPILVDQIRDFGGMTSLVLVFGLIISGSILINPEFTIKSGRLGMNITERVRSNPLAIGELGGMLMVFAMLYLGTGSKAFWTPVRLAAFGIGAVLSLYSGSRGQVLLATGTGLFFYPFARRLRSVPNFLVTVIVLVVLTLVGLFVVVKFLDPDLAKRWDSNMLAEGAEVRRLNVLDLIRAWAITPIAWITGLGWNAFSALTDASSEPYSHSLLVDIPCELGLPMLGLYLWMLYDIVRDCISLFRSVREDPIQRSSVASMIALAAYQFLLSNKQGHLWGVCQMFMVFLWIHRVRVRSDELGLRTEVA